MPPHAVSQKKKINQRPTAHGLPGSNSDVKKKKKKKDVVDIHGATAGDNTGQTGMLLAALITVTYIHRLDTKTFHWLGAAHAFLTLPCLNTCFILVGVAKEEARMIFVKPDKLITNSNCMF